MITDDYKLPNLNLKSHVPSPLWPDVGLFYQCKRYLHHANIRIYKPHWPTMVREYSILEKNNYFSLKCCTPLPLLANVVYKFECLRDANTFYIGKTIRHLATRVKEHGSSNSNSAIYSHLLSCETCKSNFSCNNFSVIDSCKNDFEVTIKEAFHIKFSKPIMNKQLFTPRSSFVLNVF